MSDSYELTQLDAHSFEHMVNFLSLNVLGRGVTGFAQGADGGRDGLFIGEAPYPSETERWTGTWYVQSKFHKPHLSKNSQAWLVSEVKKEIEQFKNSESRVAPDIWIIATNIEPSGHPRTGCYDSIKKDVEEYFGQEVKFDIWGGRKILDFLAADPNAASYYGHFLTPGNVLSAIYNQIGDSSAQVRSIINHLILDQFNDQIYTKLEQAGSLGIRPKIHELFVDLPALCRLQEDEYDVMETLVCTSANVHKPTVWNSFGDGWREWSNVPKRARVILLKGGPGQGKSTAGQYYSQVQRAALLLESDAPTVMPDVLELAKEFVKSAEEKNFAPINPRIPISVELKDFASWYGSREKNESCGLITYLCEKISQRIDQKVEGGTLKRAFKLRSWFVSFDGLDEVPNDVKDNVANEVTRLANVILPELDSDAVILCTTRPQGYSGQFENLNSATLELSSLPSEVAMKCAEGVIRFGRSDTESENSISILSSAMESPQVRELMTTPLQSHIMAVVVRDGGRPPEKRWELFDNFYQVMKKRESLKNFPDVRISKLLRENSTLLKAIHARLGVTLHASAEISKGADTTLDREQFQELARQTTELYVEENVDDLVETLMEATIERLVFVNTPESSTTLRFDIRQLQEFFAAEFLYLNVDPLKLRARFELIAADSHWREVMHFAVSALVVNMRPTELAVALEVICEIDDCDCSHNARIFKRRMGIGAMLSLRLLCEGVLEQDKVVRLKFKDSITPLFAMVDSEVTKDLAALSQPNTLAWLLNCMIDALFEYSEPEQVGAAISLSIKLSDSHPRSSEVQSKIFSSTPSYINRVLQSHLAQHYSVSRNRRKMESPEWFFKGVLELLLEGSPRGVDLNLVLRLVKNTKNSIEKAASLGVSGVDLELLSILIDSFDTGEEFKETSIKTQAMTIACYKHNWMTGTIPDEFDIDVNKLKSESPVLRLLSHAIRFAKERSLCDLLKVGYLIEEFDLDAVSLPSRVQTLLPFKFELAPISLQLSYFESLSQAELEGVLSSPSCGAYKLPSVYSIIDIGSVDSWEKIKELSEYHPDIAVSLWLQLVIFNRLQGFSITEDSRPFIYNLIKKNPDVIIYHFTSWGAIFEHLGEYASDIRYLLLHFSLTAETDVERFLTKPFLIDVSTELNFLPLLAQAILSSGTQGFYDPEGDASELTFESYGLSEVMLKSIFESEDHSVLVRAAALVCYMSQSAVQGNKIFSDFFDGKNDALALYLSTLDLPLWYTRGVAYSLEHFDHNQECVMEFAGQLLHNYRTHYAARSELQSLLSKWRERSAAPVQNKKVLGVWLAG